MTSILLAQTTPPAVDPELQATIVRYLQQGLWSPYSVGSIVVAFVCWAVLFGLATFLCQRDVSQWSWGVFDIRGHLAHLADGTEAMRFNKRPLWVILALAVLSWSVWLLFVWDNGDQLNDIDQMQARSENSALRLAITHSFVSSLESYRDLTSQSTLMALAIGASLLMFIRTPELSVDLRVGLPQPEALGYRQLLGGMWIFVVMYVTLRTLILAIEPTNAPLTTNVLLEGFFLTCLQLPTDGLLLAWLLGELATGIRGRSRWSVGDSVAFVRFLVPACIVCFLMNPTRYVLQGWLALQVRFGSGIGSPELWDQILTAVACYSAFSLTFAPIPALMITRRSTRLRDIYREYVNLMRAAGGRVFAILICAFACKFVVLSLIFGIFVGMQPETWTLYGASSYGHYATLLVDLLLLTALSRLAANELGIKSVVKAEKAIIVEEEPIELPLAETPAQEII